MNWFLGDLIILISLTQLMHIVDSTHGLYHGRLEHELTGPLRIGAAIYDGDNGVPDAGTCE